MDLGLNHVTRKFADAVDHSAHALIAVPGGVDGPSGVWLGLGGGGLVLGLEGGWMGFGGSGGLNLGVLGYSKCLCRLFQGF